MICGRVRNLKDSSCNKGRVEKGREIPEKQDADVETVPHDGCFRASLVVDLSLVGNGAECQVLERRESRFRAAKAELPELNKKSLP